MNTVVIELLKKKDSSDTQGASVVSIAGMSETSTQQSGGQRGSRPFAAILGEIQEDIHATLELYRKRKWVAV